MTTPFWCLIFVLFIPIVLAWIGAYFRVKQFDVYDNNDPRLQSAKLQGTGARVMAAQQNSWEALLMFAVAVFVAHLAGADPADSSFAAMLFVGARIVYPIAYMANLAAVRTGVYAIGLASCVWLLVLAAQA